MIQGFLFYYALNDDMAIRDLLSGAFSGRPLGINQQLLYPLSFIISRLYRLFPGVNWFGLILVLLQFTALCLICVLLCEMTGAPIKKGAVIFISAVTAVAFAGSELVFVQYSVCSGLIAITVMLMFYESVLSSGCRRHVTDMLLLTAVGFCLRSEMFLFMLPMGLVLYLRVARLCMGSRDSMSSRDGVVGRDRELLHRILGTVCLAAVLMALLFAADKHAFKREGWQEARGFFEARTRCYDFCVIPEYGEAGELYEGLGFSENDVDILHNYNIGLDGRIDEKALETIADYADTHRPESVGRRLYMALYSYVYRLVMLEDIRYELAAVVLYLVCIAAALIYRRFWLLADAGVLFAVRSALMIFLLYRNRAPERITHPLYMAELIFLFVILKDELAGVNRGKTVSFVRSLMLVFVLVTAVLSVGDVVTEYGRRQQVNAEWLELTDYMRSRSEDLFILDVYSTVAYSEKIFASLDAQYDNYLLMGGWISRSPAETAKLERHGHESIEEALLSDEVFFVIYGGDRARDASFITKYYGEQGLTVNLERVDTVAGFDIVSVRQQ